MSKASEKVKTWRRRTKARMIASMGGQCAICGYKKCHAALAFHHLDPSKKDFGFGAMRASPKNWLKIVDELKKCILLCHICHEEIHDGMTQIPKEYPQFDEKYRDYKALQGITIGSEADC